MEFNFQYCTTIEQVNKIEREAKAALREEYSKAKKRITDKLDKATHKQVKDWQQGETIYFDHMKKGDIALSGLHLTDSIDCDQAVMWWYQPRKKIVWLKFAKVDNPHNPSEEDGGGYLPFSLSSVRKWNMKRTDV